MFFFSVIIPGILQETYGETRTGEKKAYAGMTAEKPLDVRGQGIEIASFRDNADALSVLYEQFRRPIHSYIYRLLGNLEDADDVTQEVFVRACIAWDGLYERDRLKAWLYRIATNLCVDLLRRRKRISWWPLMRRNHTGEYLDGFGEENAPYLSSDNGGIPEIAEREHIRLALANMPLD